MNRSPSRDVNGWSWFSWNVGIVLSVEVWIAFNVETIAAADIIVEV